MKKVLFVLVLTVFVISACGSTPATTISVSTNTSVPSPTETLIPPTPTSTLEPSPTPVPLGGGGKFIMQVNQLIVPQEFRSQESPSWFSASSDGTNVKLLDWQIWSISLDGKRALTYTSDGKVALTNLDGTGEIPLDDSLDYYILPRSNVHNQTALWLQNGDIVVLAREKDNRTKFSVNVVSQDGKLKKLEKPSQIVTGYATFLFTSPDGKYLYWKSCQKQSCKFYVTTLDDAEQKQILQKSSPIQYINISPSGEYISYGDTSGGCYLYKVADSTTTKVMLEDGTSGWHFCNGNRWSPKEDKLFATIPTGYATLNVADGKITTFSGVNADSCYIANWTPDGKSVFLSTCTKENSYKENGLGQMGGIDNVYFSSRDFIQSIGARLIDISNGKVKEYPDAGFCNAVISPDSRWVLYYQCKNENNLAVNSPQLLNLDTKELFPVFQEFISDDPKVYDWRSNDGLDRSWLVFWIP